MIGRIKHIVSSVPIEECIEYYMFFTDNCAIASEFDYQAHLIAKLHDCCRHHKIGIICEFRAYNMFAWLEYLEKKYNL